jgi:hypothetical protein
MEKNSSLPVVRFRQDRPAGKSARALHGFTLPSHSFSILRYPKKGIIMKKLTFTLTILGALASNAFAHHMAAYEDAGIYIPEWSPHLLMEF